MNSTLSAEWSNVARTLSSKLQEAQFVWPRFATWLLREMLSRLPQTSSEQQRNATSDVIGLHDRVLRLDTPSIEEWENAEYATDQAAEDYNNVGYTMTLAANSAVRVFTGQVPSERAQFAAEVCETYALFMATQQSQNTVTISTIKLLWKRLTMQHYEGIADFEQRFFLREARMLLLSLRLAQPARDSTERELAEQLCTQQRTLPIYLDYLEEQGETIVTWLRPLAYSPSA